MAPRRAQRRDANEQQLRAELEALGAVVLGELPVDLLVGFEGRWYLMEVKDPAKPPSERRLRPRQAEFLATARARRLPACCVLRLEDALIELGVIR